MDDLQTVWRTAADPAPSVSADDLAELRTEADRFDRAIRWRDRREYAAAVLLMVVFGWGFPVAPPAGRVGIVLAISGAAFVCVWIWRAQRRRPPVEPGASTVDALRVAVARVEIQIELLRSVAWWYLAPLMVGPLVLLVVGAVAAVRTVPPIGQMTTRNLIGFSIALALAAAILAAVGGFFWWIYRINRRAAERDLVPLRDRLAATLHSLTDSDA